MRNLIRTIFPSGLSDPRWQGVSGLVGIVGILLAVLVPYVAGVGGGEPILSIGYSQPVPAFTILRDLPGLSLQIVDRGLDPDRLLLRVYKITNSGGRPIRPTDFVSPLVIRSNDNEAVLTGRMFSLSNFKPDPIWRSIVGEEIQLGSMLLNPRDELTLIVITEQRSRAPFSFKTVQDWPDLDWTIDIANARVERQSLINQANLPEFAAITVVHIGWSVYLVVICSTMLFIATTLTFKGSSRITLRRTVMLAGAFVLSLCSGEILVDNLFVHMPQPAFVWYIIGFHFVAVVWLGIRKAMYVEEKIKAITN